MWRIRIALMALAAGIAFTALVVPRAQAQAQAQTWPTKPLRAFIPFAAGSATDLVPRALFESLATELGQPIVVENRGGAGGTIAGNAVVRSDPDGYTILATGSNLTIAPWIVPSMPYDAVKELTGALMIGQNANVLIVSPSKGWNAAQDLVAAAKAKPGSINYGSAGVGTATHISAERFRLSAGFEAVHIPYKGGAEALADVLGGRIDFYYCPISTALPFIRDGRVLALAVSTPKRA
jgi:tripartite-type tricarboxylate transporter receptor subunit TctC